MKRTSINYNLFLDSGAFSALIKNQEINIYDYINFIKKNKKTITFYSNLDIINDPKGTLKNQKIMEQANLSPIPCFHYGEDFYYLQYYIKKYPYISIGGMVPISTKKLQPWLDYIFNTFICDTQGMPKVKIHGFGMGIFKLIKRYPWYSVDSSSGIITSRLGIIYFPIKKDGIFDFTKAPIKLNVSNKTDKRIKRKGKIYKNLEQYLNILNCISKRSIKEKITIHKLIKNHEIRDEINLFFLINFISQLKKWPWCFTTNKSLF